MNLAWMAALAVVFLVEKNWRYGEALTRVVGTAVLVLGLAVVVQPDLLPGGMPVDTMSEMSLGR